MNTIAFRKTFFPCAAAGAVAALAPAIAGAQHFTAWGPASIVAELNSPLGDGCPIEAPDGLHFYLASNRPGTLGANDIWVAERPSKDAAWGEPQNIGPPVNSAAADYCPTPLPGNWLMFVSERPVDPPCSAGPGAGDMYIVHRNPKTGWGTPHHLGCIDAGNGPNSAGAEFSPSLVETSEGTLLFFSSVGAGGQDIYVSKLGDDGRFLPPTVVAELSTPFDDRMPNVSKDGREIVFSSSRPTWGGGQPAAGSQDVYTATRDSVTGLWSDPVNVVSVNTPGSETRASMSRDRERLYFGRDGEIYTSSRSKLTGHDGHGRGHDDRDDDYDRDRHARRQEGWR